jgi:hypothetical protein
MLDHIIFHVATPKGDGDALSSVSVTKLLRLPNRSAIPPVYSLQKTMIGHRLIREDPMVVRSWGR